MSIIINYYRCAEVSGETKTGEDCRLVALLSPVSLRA